LKARKYVNSQSGAALLLVLFVVLFLSITGSVLLNATTYSLKSNEKNERLQEEFYSAEGAVDLVLDDMESYEGKYVPIELRYDNGNLVTDVRGKPIIKDVQQKGRYFYLNNLSMPSTITKSIGGKFITVTIDKTVVNPDAFQATINASVDNISRDLELKVSKGKMPTLSSGGLNKPIHFKDSFNYSGSKNHDELDIDTNNARISDSTYQTILDNFDFENSIIYDNLDEFWNTNDPDSNVDPNQVNSSNKGNGKGDSKAKTVTIIEYKLYEFIRQMKYKCEKFGIEFVQVDRFYPSSKTCSSCGHVKKDLKLSD
jgi:Putative transposase DNA-binding domain